MVRELNHVWSCRGSRSLLVMFPVSLPPAFAPCPVCEGPEALQSLFLPLAWLWTGTDFPFLFPIIFPLALPYLPAVPLLTVPGW